MKISLLFGKKVESDEYSSGYVLDVLSVNGRICALKCADSDENEFFVPVKSIKRIDEVIYYTYAEDSSEGTSLSLGKRVYASDGTCVGILTDIITQKYTIKYMVVNNKKIAAEETICGDAVIVKSTTRFLKSDVLKNSRILFKKGTPLTPQIQSKAHSVGEYIQTHLKSL